MPYSTITGIKKVKLIIVALTAVIGLAGYYWGSAATFRAAANSSGPPSSHTGAPGENNCAACHTDFPVNSGSGLIRISGLPANYTPGQSIPVTVTINQENAVVFGFQTAALDSLNLQAGNYTLPAQNPAQAQIINGSVGGSIRRYVEHTRSGINPTVFNTKSWTFNWQAPATRRGKVTFYAAGNGANSDGSSSGDYVYTTNSTVCSGTVQGNFDTDNKADLAVFRPSVGTWYRTNSSNNQFNSSQFGQMGDKIMPGDFDGDGKNDLAVFRSSNGTWYITRSSDNGFLSFQFGASSDVPLIGDFDGDGKSELTVFRPSTGIWYSMNLVNSSVTATQFGQNGDKPVSGDFDGDGKTDLAVFRPANGTWYAQRSAAGFISTQFGASEDRPVPGDYDSDGKTDLAVYRPSSGFWYIQKSTAGFSSKQFGQNGDLPVPTDFDGDCQTEIGVFRPSNGFWYVFNSSNSQTIATQFGQNGDVPIPTAYAAE